MNKFYARFPSCGESFHWKYYLQKRHRNPCKLLNIISSKANVFGKVLEQLTVGFDSLSGSDDTIFQLASLLNPRSFSNDAPTNGAPEKLMSSYRSTLFLQITCMTYKHLVPFADLHVVHEDTVGELDSSSNVAMATNHSAFDAALFGNFTLQTHQTVAARLPYKNNLQSRSTQQNSTLVACFRITMAVAT